MFQFQKFFHPSSQQFDEPRAKNWCHGSLKFSSFCAVPPWDLWKITLNIWISDSTFKLGRGSGSRKIVNPGKSWSSGILNPKNLNPGSFSNPESRKSQSQKFRIPEIISGLIPDSRRYQVTKNPWKSKKKSFISRWF